MPDVRFIETHHYQRRGKTLWWREGEIYPHDAEMDQYIRIGHAEYVEPAPSVELPADLGSDTAEAKDVEAAAPAEGATTPAAPPAA